MPQSHELGVAGETWVEVNSQLFKAVLKDSESQAVAIIQADHGGTFDERVKLDMPQP